MIDLTMGNEDEFEEDDDVSWEDAFAEAAGGQSTDAEDAMLDAAVATAEGALQPGEEGDGDSKGQTVDIDFLLDIALDVAVEIGRKKILINDLLQMQQGSVVTLDKMIGEPFDVLVNGKIMAYGEVVMINEKFGVRLTDVVDPRERIEKLR